MCEVDVDADVTDASTDADDDDDAAAESSHDIERRCQATTMSNFS